MSFDPRPPPYRIPPSILQEYDPRQPSTGPRGFGFPGQPSSPFASSPSLAAPPFLRQPFQSYSPSYPDYSTMPPRPPPPGYPPPAHDVPERQPHGPVRIWGRSAPHSRPHPQPYPAQPHERSLERQKGGRDRARGGTAARKQRTLTKQRDEASAQVEALQRRVAELEEELDKERELRYEAERAVQEMEEQPEEEEEVEEEQEQEPQAVQTQEEREWAAGQGIFSVLQEAAMARRGLARVVAAHEAARRQA
ncbi:hypothetical protein JCM9279_000861 [Rhodotorula babjevae]